LQLGTLLFVPMGAFMPAALPLLWTTNTFIGVAQAQLFSSAGMRQRLQLPPLPISPSIPGFAAAAAPSPERGAAAEAAAVAAAAQAAAAAAAARPPPPGQGPFRALHKPSLKPGMKKPSQYVKPGRS
jgi:membrane protein insertase Oxa1/YidC/SpoIIIJ